MATGGFEVESEKTPIMEKTDDQDDGDAGPGGDQTTEFEPGASSTPAPNGNQRQTTLNRPGEQPSFDVSKAPDVERSTTKFAKEELIKYFSDFDRNGVRYFMEKDRLIVGAIGQKTVFPLLTKIQGKDEYQINPKIKGTLLKRLGKSTMEILEKEQNQLMEGMRRNKKVAENPNESKTERKKALERFEMQKARNSDIGRQLYYLRRPDLHHSSEEMEMETFQKNDEVREEKLQEIQIKKIEQQEIKNNKNSTPAEIKASTEKINELEIEENDIENKREREIEQLPLRDRLREKVKAIFKKYGFTVGAVFLAVGTTLGVVLSSLSNSLKTVSKNVGNGLKTLGKKIAPILPGIIGAVVSFVLRTAGNVISFLGKHAWLLILAVAAFLFERVMKRRG